MRKRQKEIVIDSDGKVARATIIFILNIRKF